jgi:Tfp pilus assembly protein PilN
MIIKLFKNAVGIEFRDDSLIAACLKKDFRAFKLISSITIPSSYSAMNEDAVSKLRGFVLRHNVDAGNVSAAIPAEWCLVKFMDIPSPDQDAVRDLLRYEIERHIPFPLEDVYYSFKITGKNNGGYRVVIAVVQKERIEQLKEFLTRISLQPKVISVSPFSILNAVALSGYKPNIAKELSGIQSRSDIFGNRDEAGIALFMEQDNWNMAVMKNGFCINLKRINLDDGRLEGIWNNISDEMTAALSELSIKKADRMVISGNLTTEQFRFISDKAGMPIKVVEKFSFYSVGSPDMNLLPSIGVCLSGLGLGDIAINMLPERERKIDKAGALIAKLSAAAALILSLWLGVSWITTGKDSIKTVENEIKRNEPEIRAVEALFSELTAIEKQNKFLKEAKAGGVGKLEMLSELTSIIPADAWVTNLTYKETKDEKKGDKKEVVINGFAGSSAKLIGLIENSPLFEGVEFIGPVTKGMQGEGFKIKAMVVKPDNKAPGKKQ